MAGVLRVDESLLRSAILSHTADLLRQATVSHVKATTRVDGPYVQSEGYQLPTAASPASLRERIATEAEALRARFPALAGVAADLDERVAGIAVYRGDVQTLWRDYVALLESVPERYLPRGRPKQTRCRVGFADGRLLLAMGAQQSVDMAADRALSVPDFLAAVAELRRAQRAAGRPLTVEELAALQIAYRYLDQGFRASLPYMPWGHSGFRAHQTLMSVTDPGEGHLDGTTATSANLDGVIVHVEHLERGADQDRYAVEAYRIPYPSTISKVRLNVGAEAPCSSYVGRPVFEGDPRQGMLKAVNTLAAACSALLMDGLAECKLAIERMTATEAVEFMRTMVAAVRRDRHTQILSAAFNLNTPIVDDRGGAPRLVTDRLQIGLLGIELASLGGFEKVTWDGAANSYPSRCVMEQISFADALTLVHRAHERGLLTYFSAGFRFNNLPAAVLTGVDGVGVGGAQILRYMDAKTGHHGPFIDENIATILDIRDRTEASVRGQAAQVLARLDRMRFETSISVEGDRQRSALFRAMCAAETSGDGPLRSLLASLEWVRAIELDDQHPVMAWMARLERIGTASLAARALPTRQWRETLARLRQLAGREDFAALANELAQLRSRVEDRLLDGTAGIAAALPVLAVSSGFDASEAAA